MCKKKETRNELTDEDFREACKEIHCKDGSIEMDGDATVSVSDHGAYVQVWVWVDNNDVSE